MRSRRIPGDAVAGTPGNGSVGASTHRRIPGPVVDFDAGAGVPVDISLGPTATFGQPAMDGRLRLDPELAAHVARLIDEARAEGFRQGTEAGRVEAEARLDSLGRAVALTVGEIEDRIERTRQGTIGGVIDLARAIARHVIGRTPHDDGAALLLRIEETLDLLDERPLTIAVSAADTDVVRAVAAGHPDLHVETSPQLGPGEAIVTGGWSHADLTYEAAWATIDRHLGE